MNTVRIFNLSFQIWGSLTSIIVVICMLLLKSKKTNLDKIYMLLVVLNTGVLLDDAMALCFRGSMEPGAYLGVRVTNFFVFLFDGLVSYTFCMFMAIFVEKRIGQKISRMYTWIAGMMMLFHACILIVNVWYPFLYDFGSNNTYRRLSLYVLLGILRAVTFLLEVLVLSKYGQSLAIWEKVSFIVFIMIPLISGYMSFRKYTIVFGEIGTTLMLVTTFVYIQGMEGRRLAEQETELTKNRVMLMMSQMKPHFIFNTLNSIEYLCETGSPEAGTAVNRFASFLRENVESAGKKTMVPFEDELKKVENYLYIEKLRFPHIEIIYDLQCRDFMIPPLSLQPMVENAIKHGLRNKMKDAWVKISTYRDEKYYYLVIVDNGSGFDQKHLPDDGKIHVGINNTRDCLAMICGGSMEINSNRRDKTEVIIKIPQYKGDMKKVNEHEDSCSR